MKRRYLHEELHGAVGVVLGAVVVVLQDVQQAELLAVVALQQPLALLHPHGPVHEAEQGLVPLALLELLQLGVQHGELPGDALYPGVQPSVLAVLRVEVGLVRLPLLRGADHHVLPVRGEAGRGDVRMLFQATAQEDSRGKDSTINQIPVHRVILL